MQIGETFTIKSENVKVCSVRFSSSQKSKGEGVSNEYLFMFHVESDEKEMSQTQSMTVQPEENQRHLANNYPTVSKSHLNG